jgi:DNA-binding LytR/AlgR family response regulator
MNALSILVVEDQLVIAQDIKYSLIDMGHEVAGIARSYKDAVSLLKEKKIDLAILDIKLKGQRSGMDIARLLKLTYPHIPFIFLTSFADKKTVSDAREVKPYGYIVKPFAEEDLFTTIEMAMANFEARQDAAPEPEGDTALTVKTDYIYLKIPFQDIQWLEADGHYVNIHTTGEVHRVRESLSDLEQKLPSDRFLRIHRAYLVHLNYVTRAYNKQVFLGNKALPTSRRRWATIIERIQP